MDHTLQVLANLAVVVFVISSMLSMGLSLTLQESLLRYTMASWLSWLWS